MRRIGFLLFCLTCLLKLQSQDLSNKGRDFWITYPAHVDSTTSTLGIYITSDVDASGSVQAKGINIPFSITANTVKRVFIGPGGDASNSTVYLRELDSVLVNSAVHVTANRPVVVYGHIIRQARSGASLILPSTVWGREYLVPSYQSTGQVAGNSGLAAITVVAKDTNTVVEITPKVQSYNGKRPAGLPYTITLINPGDVYQVIYQKDADISGTVVKSVATNSSTCKPIGVFSSTTWSAFDCTAASGGDNLFQQLFPTRAFGKSFLTAPFINRNYDIIRVFVTDPTTVVTRKEKGVTTTLSGLQANSFYEIKTNLPNAIDADKPVSVVQYITSQSCYQSIFQADPEMVILSPTEQTINNITVFSAHQNFVPVGQSNVNQCYLNIIIKTAGAPGFKINGSPPKGSFVAIPGTGYSFLQEDVSVLSSTNPVQTLKADSNFSAIAYGYGNVESYGYNAGTNVRDLYQFITLKNQYATVNFPATCVNTPFQFYITLPYQATKLVWQFNKQFPDITVNNPVPDSTYQKDNKTLYQFRLTNTFSYPSTGTFPVTVIATNASSDGCDGEQQIDYDLQVFEKPKAKFNWQHTGCVTDAVTFSDTSRSVGSIVNRWNWQFGDNTGSTLKNPVKLFSNPGSYTVKESIITDIGCQADSTATINVSSLPVALFTAVAPFCANSKLVLKDASTIGTGTINKWYWDYGNGKKDTLTSSGVASAVYSTPGNYTINLIVQAVGGCTSKAFTQTIAVSDKPVPDFQTPQAVCLPKGDAKFINQSTISNFAANPLTYNWDFGDGSSIDTATNPLHVFITAGPFTVKLTATSKAGCAADSTKIITSILAQPIASFTGKATVCLRDSSIFTDASTTVNQTVVKYYWDRGNGTIDSSKNQAYIYQLPGTFNVKHWVVTDKGCVSDTVTKQQQVHALPVAAFTVTGGVCQLQQITFNNQSTSTSAAINRWQWDLGDGTKKDLNNGNSFTYSYPNTGNRVISLVVTTADGCISDSSSKTITLLGLPTANFGLPVLCVTDAVANFTDSSVNQVNGPLTYLWKFGDANATAANPDTSILKDASHKYIASGNYSVNLSITTKDGCTASVTKKLTVNGNNPKPDFDILNNNVCSNSIIAITNKSSVNFGAVTKLEIFWNWPSVTEKTTDSTPLAGKNYQYTYPSFSAPANKSFNIRMVAYSGTLCQNELIKTVTLSAVPQVIFNQIPGICPESAPVSLTQASTLVKVAGVGNYSGTGVSNGVFNPAVTGPGVYKITYIFAGTAGCSDSASQTITVWPVPKAAFGVSNPVCETNPVTISDSSVAGFGKIKTWNWTFGDGSNLDKTNGLSFTKTYAAAGSFNLQVKVTTDSGCVSSFASKSIKVNPNPEADFDLPVSACVNTPVSFLDKSIISDNSASQFTFSWQFGFAGGSATAKDPQIAFPASGNYPISLQVTSKDGCKSLINKLLSNVLPQPLASFQSSKQHVCAGDSIAFTDLSNPLSQTVASWRWSFNDGGLSASRNTTHVWTKEGTYQVTLSYTTNIGCNSDTAAKPVVIYAVPVVDAGPDIFVLQGGQKTILATVSGGSNYQYQWTPGTWLSSTTILQPVVMPTADITYTLKVTSEGGCKASDNVLVRYLDNPLIPNAFSPNGDGINDVWNIRYIDSYPESTVTVFDRYGKQVYAGKGAGGPWDGKLGGRVVPAGVYYYIIDLKIGKPAFTGSLTILQ